MDVRGPTRSEPASRRARLRADRGRQFDAFIASQDGKFTYWYIRPPQLDPAIVPLFPVPNFPSYPSNHSTFSAAKSEMLAYLFPTRADFIRALERKRAIREYGPASTSRWTTPPVCSWKVRGAGLHRVGAERWIALISCRRRGPCP